MRLIHDRALRQKVGKRITSIDEDRSRCFALTRGRGNVRELQNVVERAVILSDGDTFVVDESWFRREASRVPALPASLTSALAASERELIDAALAACKGCVSGQRGAAARLGLPRQTLDSRIRALHIDK